MPSTSPKVLIVGAGPVGLFTVLRLAQAGIPVEVMEQKEKLDDSPRAAGYFAGALISLERAGILQKVEDTGFTSSGICWRRPLQEVQDRSRKMGDIIACLPFYNYQGSSTKRSEAVVYLPQHELVQITLDECVSTGLVTVNFSHRLSSIEDNGDFVKATFETPNGLEVNSLGHSWPERIVAIDFLFNTDQTDLQFPTSLVVHPINFGLITPLRPFDSEKKTLYRCSVAVAADDERSDEELTTQESIQQLLDAMLPGPRPLQVEQARASAYKAHQVCASTFRRGRCLLAGDAAHLNNPWGAMGLTTGLLDAEALADTLDLTVNEGQSPDLLNLYSDERSCVFQFFVSPMTSQNKLRVATDPDNALDDWFLRSMVSPSSQALTSYGTPFVHTWRTDIRKLVAKVAAEQS